MNPARRIWRLIRYLRLKRKLAWETDPTERSHLEEELEHLKQ